MRPIFSISVAGSNITGLVQDRFISLTVQDQAGWESDEFELVMDNRDAKIAKPRKGADVSVSLGYQETGLSFMGRFVVDQVVISGPPDQLTIKGKAADLLQGLKVRRTTSWDETTLGDVAAVIAARHGLTPKVSEDLAGITIQHEDQADSDLNFLTRMAATHDAVAKPAAECLILAPRAQAKAVSTGQALAQVGLVREDLESWSMTEEGRAEHGAVRAYWQDLDTAKRQPVEVGGGDGPTETVQGQFATEEEARKAATSRFKQLQRGTARLELTTQGNPLIMAEAPLTVSGISGIEGTWSITLAKHTLDSDGYSTEVEAEVK